VASSLIARLASEGRVLLTEVEAKQVLAEAGVPVTRAELARDPREAVAIADRIGYPVVLKVVSTTIAHKSDVGGVALNLGDARAVEAAYVSLVATVRAAVGDGVEGVSVQPMARPGIEVVVGMTRDPQFGPVVMFGLGGVLVEVLDDVSFRVVPLAERDARAMIREVRGFRLLEGYRGHPPADLRALEKLLLRLSAFIEENPAVSEVDLNPVFAYPDGAVAVDARVALALPHTEEDR